MLKKIGAKASIVSKPEEILAADKLILPGVGAFDAGISRLSEKGMIEPLYRRVVKESVPVLGICLGMQLLTIGSEEGEEEGLGWIKAKTVRFDPSLEHCGKRIPHMGWNAVNPLRRHPLFKGLESDARFYFVHSYHVVPLSSEVALAKTFYGTDFISAIADGNIMGVQFHPEKSHKFGMQLMKNFVENC